ncbi:hypothetical protein DM860_008399 [Cuscuta australis]|uniref:Uncharacterized protein n=1 Tax=Cuscuta australis TaxID=267555 RepID=A0A328D8R8_9ASTE|nr:hypothetical protein DM860_008399 [Cuscuta australis]
MGRVVTRPWPIFGGGGGILASDLELCGFDGNRNANEDDSSHGDGGIALPMHGPAVRSAGHGPDLGPEVTGRIGVVVSVVSSSSHVLSAYRSKDGVWNAEFGMKWKLSAIYSFSTTH